MLIQKFNRFTLTLFFIAGLFSTTSAQSNLPYVDQELIHFGFSLGLNTMDFGVTPSRDSINGKVYDARVSTLKPGFSVGIISDLRLNRYLNLRFTPTLHFGERLLNYIATDGNAKDSTTIQSIPISLPIYLKYSAERKGNYRPYLIAGGGIYYNLSRDETQPIVLQPVDFFAEFGVGCDIYFSFFKLAPELKYSIGFNNMLVPLNQRTGGNIDITKQKFSNAISRLTSNMLTLTFNFE